MTLDVENKNPERRTERRIETSREDSAYKRLGPPDRRRKNPDYPKAVPIEPGIHMAFIKAELERAGYTQKRVAAELNLSTPTIYQIIKGTGKSRRVAEFIADKTGLTLDQMWPGKYKEKAEDATELE